MGEDAPGSEWIWIRIEESAVVASPWRRKGKLLIAIRGELGAWKRRGRLRRASAALRHVAHVKFTTGRCLRP